MEAILLDSRVQELFGTEDLGAISVCREIVRIQSLRDSTHSVARQELHIVQILAV